MRTGEYDSRSTIIEYAEKGRVLKKIAHAGLNRLSVDGQETPVSFSQTHTRGAETILGVSLQSPSSQETLTLQGVVYPTPHNGSNQWLYVASEVNLDSIHFPLQAYFLRIDLRILLGADDIVVGMSNPFPSRLVPSESYGIGNYLPRAIASWPKK